MEQRRPDPDTLLRRVQAEETKQMRGKLKVFFGATAGVGKTYAMLGAAHEQKNDGVDVVLGWVETHGRAETEALLEGLTMLPPVSLPIENPTSPAAVAAPGPALDPDAPSSSSQGFIVCPPNQISFSASAPRLSFATSTAPASCRHFTIAASSAGTRFWKGSAP